MTTIIELVVSLVAILGAAALFTNAVEMLGERLNLGSGAVGSVLAAVGTALPETMIPVVALIGAALAGGSAAEAASEIGIGAILGAPFLLATLAMFVVGLAALGFRGRRQNGTDIVIEKRTTRRDMVYFLVLFAVAAGVGIVTLPTYVKVLVGIVLIVAYAFYVWRTIVAGGEQLEDVPNDLTIWPESSWGRAPTWAVVVQLLATLLVMGAGAHFFVEGVESASEALSIPAGLISLVLAPLATELAQRRQGHFGTWEHNGGDGLSEHPAGRFGPLVHALGVGFYQCPFRGAGSRLGPSLSGFPPSQSPDKGVLPARSGNPVRRVRRRGDLSGRPVGPFRFLAPRIRGAAYEPWWRKNVELALVSEKDEV
jgi:cation:H+ antiporter